ncbi:MAG: 30S ribosomal protein S17 [Candidatus Woesearchaeota archaeon]
MKQAKLKTRGRSFIGKVISAKAQRTVTVEWIRRVYIPKYERYQQKKSKVKAHNPDEISAKEGDNVLIKECRPISKTKKFVVVEVLK